MEDVPAEVSNEGIEGGEIAPASAAAEFESPNKPEASGKEAKL